MALSAESKVKLQRAARARCDALHLDPEGPAAGGPQWARICREVIQSIGWTSSVDCPDIAADVLVMLCEQWEPNEFVHGDETKEYRNGNES